jgi:hypothetical protein
MIGYEFAEKLNGHPGVWGPRRILRDHVGILEPRCGSGCRRARASAECRISRGAGYARTSVDRRSNHLLKPGPVGTQPLQAVDLDLVPSSRSLEPYLHL